MGYVRSIEPKYKNAAVAFSVLAAVALVVYFVHGGSKTPSCGLTALAAGAVVAGVSHGHDTAEILAPGLTSVAVPAACSKVVDTLVNDPSKTVKLKVSTPTGQLTTSATGSEIQGSSSTGQLTCDDWLLAALRQSCLSGEIGPPTIR